MLGRCEYVARRRADTRAVISGLNGAKMDKRFVIDGVGALTPFGEAAPLLLAAKAEPVFELERAVREGRSVAAVHDMRVASRRLRETVRLLELVYRTQEFSDWYREVRRITSALGPLRDADVFIESISRWSEDLPEGGRRAAAFFVGYRIAAGEGEVERLRRELGRMELPRRRRLMKKLLQAPIDKKLAKRTLADFAHAAVAERASTVLKATLKALPDSAINEQHALRVVVKRLRYAVEVFAPAYGDSFDEVHEALSAFQDALGDLHDAHLFLDTLSEPRLVAFSAGVGVRESDLAELVDACNAQAFSAYSRFVALAEEYPEERLLALLLLPLSRPTAAEEPPAEEPPAEPPAEQPETDAPSSATAETVDPEPEPDPVPATGAE
jgi:CHAD domain-containing protein